MNSHQIKTFTNIPSLENLKNHYPSLKAIFFDMDGTLFNTEPHHAKAFLQMGMENKITPPYSKEIIHQMLVGKADYLVYDIVKSWPGFPTHWTQDEFVKLKNQYLLKILEGTDSFEFFSPDTNHLLINAKKDNLFLGLVTSSEKIITEKLLKMTSVDHLFDLKLTRDDCLKHKPDPWPYLKALEMSKVHPHEALIFEDSQVGLEAALNSGSHVAHVKWHV
jgi:beta-phosphoglucomutase